MRINSWPKFAKYVRSQGCNLLDKLDEYDNAVLVAGCQRSGTTIISKVITKSDGMVKFQFGTDDELDAGLILSGVVPHHENGRYCFQTTYLNECYEEYFKHGNKFKLIWVLRAPHSVVYSMMYHWKNFALNELFKAIGKPFTNEAHKKLSQRFGLPGHKKIYRACAAYNGKFSQLSIILEKLGSDRVYVVDYSDLVQSPEDTLKDIYHFIDLEYRDEYSEMIHAKSSTKADRLSEEQKNIISAECEAIYQSCRKHITGN